MKRIFLIISIALTSICYMSCQNLKDSKDSEPEYITVRLGTTGEVQTKSTGTDDLYGINVYYDPSRDGNSNTHYAYGIFDNKDDMSITLLSGYTYKFECTLVKDAKKLLYYGQYGDNTFSGYAKPFQTNVSESSQLTNSFVYGTDYLSGIDSGAATVKSASTGYENQVMPSIMRYYGRVSGYTPVTGGIVRIPLKKAVFGLRIIIDKVPEGKLSASCVVNTYDHTLISGAATSKLYDSGATIYSFPYCDASSLKATVNWNFKSSTFSQWNQSGTKEVSLKRNTLTTVTVSCSPDNSKGGIVINEEAFGEDNNIYLRLNSDGEIVIGVNPEEEEDD